MNIKKHEADVEVKVGIVSISTSKRKKHGAIRGLRIPEDDESAKIVAERLKAIDYALVGDNKVEIVRAILEMSEKCNVIVTVGGTGITPRDVTVEAVKPLVKKEIEGFGEIFRMKSYEEIGYHAILSRVFAGVLSNCVIFCLPGSKNAVKLGVEIIESTARHILSHVLGLR